MGWLAGAWGFLAAAFRSLVGGNAEAREDFRTLNDSMQVRLDKSEARQDLMQQQLDRLQSEVYEQRRENHELKSQLRECNAQHERDARTIASLTERIESLEAER